MFLGSGLQGNAGARLKAVVDQAIVENLDLGRVVVCDGYVWLHNFLTVSLHAREKRKGLLKERQ